MSVGSASRITSVQPLWAVEGGQVAIVGEGFPVDPPVQVRIGGELARPTVISSSVTSCAPGLEGGSTPVRWTSAENGVFRVATPLATGFISSTARCSYRDGNLY